MMRFMVLALCFATAAGLAAQAEPAKTLKSATAKAASKSAPVKAKPESPKKSAKSAAKTDTPQKPSGTPVQSRDLVYATLPGFRALTLDLYQPPRPPKDFPTSVLVFVHGGGWNSGDARQSDGFGDLPGTLAALAAKGYVVASVNYRLSGEARFPAALQDVKAAIRWLRIHAADYNIDTTRIAIWGEEAGGQLAALTGTSCGVSALEPAGSPANNAPSDCVEAVIDSHGISDLTSLSDANSGTPTPSTPPSATFQGAYLGCEPKQCAPGITRSASPMAYIGPNSPPFLIQHGAHKAVPLAQSQALYDALQAGHVPSEMVTYADGETDVAQKTLDKIVSFLNRTFPKKPMDKKPPPITSKALPY